MKKIINLKEIMIILISVTLITFSATVLATESVFGDEGPQQITQDEYENVQEDKNNIGNNSTGNNSTGNNSTGNNSTGNNTVKKYNTGNKTNLPQTGIEDYNVGILLIICVASAIYAYKKVNYYRNI